MRMGRRRPRHTAHGCEAGVQGAPDAVVRWERRVPAGLEQRSERPRREHRRPEHHRRAEQSRQARQGRDA